MRKLKRYAHALGEIVECTLTEKKAVRFYRPWKVLGFYVKSLKTT